MSAAFRNPYKLQFLNDLGVVRQKGLIKFVKIFCSDDFLTSNSCELLRKNGRFTHYINNS